MKKTPTEAFLTQVITKAIKGGKHENLSLRDGKVYSYDAVIGEFTGEQDLTVTDVRYSVTTSRHTNLLARLANLSGLTVSYDTLM